MAMPSATPRWRGSDEAKPQGVKRSAWIAAQESGGVRPGQLLSRVLGLFAVLHIW